MGGLRVLTWQIHSNYLYYLSQTGEEFYLPVKQGRPEGYGGRSGNFRWPDNVHEVPADQVHRIQLDCVLFQSRKNLMEDQHEILSLTQQQLPRIFLEHDPPPQHPSDTRHPANHPGILLVHVTPFNQLMWDSGCTPTRVIEHGVVVPETVRYTGELARGLVAVDGLMHRGRPAGADVFERVRKDIPLDLVGVGSEEIGGLGAVPHYDLPALAARYRFFFNPTRYASLGLAVCEAMMLGLPIVGLATTEMATVVENGVSGHVETNVDRLIERMRELLTDPSEAHRLSKGAQQRAQERFNIRRFKADWHDAFRAGYRQCTGRFGDRCSLKTSRRSCLKKACRYSQRVHRHTP